MQFNYFRYLVVALSTFLPFFAYICRLNLSMTIEQMVVHQECEPLPSVVVQDKEPCQKEESSRGSLLILEDHTLARLSYRRPSLRLRPTTRANRSARLPKRASWPLSIEFDTKLVAGQQTADTEEPTTAKPEAEVRPIGPQSEPLNWSVEARNNLLGAFFFGYLMSQVPGARAAEMFGAKPVFVASGLGCALSSLLFPLAARWSESIVYVYAIRVFMGISQGAMFPASYVLICEWLPRAERSAWLPAPSANGRLGTIAMNLLVPLVMESFGWEMVYYLSGWLTLAWAILFLLVGANSPSQSRWLSKAERIHIESRMDPVVGKTATGSEPQLKPRADASISWLKMALNRPILVMSVVMFVAEWSNMLLLVKLPGFLGPVLRMDLAEIGFWSTLMVAVYFVHFPLSGYLAAKLEAANLDSLSSLRIRKLFEMLAVLFQAIGCLMIAYSDDRATVLAALFLMMFGRATVGGGQCLMPPELSKEYPGSVFAFANTLANSAGVIGPMCVNWLVEKPSEHQSWQMLWLVSAAIFLAGGLIFLLLADNRPQNYSKRPKMAPATSQLQLALEPAQEIFSMGSFSRVSSEPDPKLTIDVNKLK